jgi:hypothetical protein
MKKKFYLFLMGVLFMGGVITASAARISLPGGKVDPTSTTTGHTKAPIRPMYIDLEDNIITMEETTCDFMLYLYDEDGVLVYSEFIPEGTTQVVLPATFSGSFLLRFENDTYYYQGYIEL